MSQYIYIVLTLCDFGVTMSQAGRRVQVGVVLTLCDFQGHYGESGWEEGPTECG